LHGKPSGGIHRVVAGEGDHVTAGEGIQVHHPFEGLRMD